MEAKKASGLQLTESIGITPTSVSKILNGQSRPRQFTLTQIMKRPCETPRGEQLIVRTYTGLESLPQEAVSDDKRNAEEEREDFVGWLRNRERANWALEIPYEHEGEHSFYPDFVIVRKVGEDLVFDIVEPHRPSEDDTYAKAKGLAQYARDHSSQFGHLLMCKVDGPKGSEVISSFDVNDPDTRDKVLKMKGNDEVQGLYEEA